VNFEFKIVKKRVEIGLEMNKSPLSLQPPNEEAEMLMGGRKFINGLYGK